MSTTDANDDPLLLTTEQHAHRPSRRRALLPCLTILGLPDRRRIGERATLKPLLAGRAVEVSRTQPLFAPSFGAPGAPLLDAGISRTPLRLRAEGSAIAIERCGAALRVNGQDAAERTVVDAAALAAGVVLELAGRAVLLLHMHSMRAPLAMPFVLGQSDAIDDVRREIENVAGIGAPVLLRGETGTGKEQVARAIHARSNRSAAELVAINMAAVPEATAVSTLFGHAKGAFTGADRRHRGAFERATGGTLLLDEIGETPRSVQATLLRAVETSRIQALGDEVERELDVRLIAATDGHLEGSGFSAALLYRLAGYEIRLPPLRERREDIALLLLKFLEDELGDAGEGERLDEYVALLIGSGFLAKAIMHSFPGNVRQLRNVARHLVISNRNTDSLEITSAVERQLEGAPPAAGTSVLAAASHPTVAPSATDRAARITDDELLAALQQNGWSPTRAAASLGIPNGTLHGLMQRSGMVRRAADIDDDELRAAAAAHDHDPRAMAEQLRVSERALRIVLRQRAL